jgi:uncharacterized DUF497 family protein
MKSEGVMLPEFQFAEIKEFEWDKGNLRKVTRRMSIETAEAAFIGNPRIRFDHEHSRIEERWFLINKVMEKWIFLVFTVRKEVIRIISSRFMHAKEVKKYE